MGKLKAPSKKHFPEGFYEFGDEFEKSVKEQSAGVGKDVLAQLFNLNFGDKAKNQPEYTGSPKDNGPVSVFDVANHQQDKKHNAAVEKYRKPQPKEERRAPIDYAAEILKTGERAERKKEQQTNKTVHELKAELERLAESSKILEREFVSITVEQTPTKVGEYHSNFFEWMLIVVREARRNVENSGAWFSTIKGKGKKRWGNKERKNWFSNTSKSLSGESVVANQTG